MTKMKLNLIYVFFFLISILLNSCTKNDETIFNELYELIEQQNFFKAKAHFQSNKNKLSKPYQYYIEAVLDNAFNKPEKSEKSIAFLTQNEKSIPDSLHFRLFEIKYDNALKLYHYEKAKTAASLILSTYRKYLDNEKIEDYENSLKIWTALESTPAQKVEIKKTTRIKMKKDIAGLKTLKINVGADSLNFIFDTGANLSTVSHSVAIKLKMDIMPVNIQVGTITGNYVTAQIAVAKKISLGSINLYNVVFLVLPDESLTFPQINYQIFGILGFPVIEAFKEVRITQNDDFIVPLTRSRLSIKSNLALAGLTPLIYLNDKHFTLDTGADDTILYHTFYEENRTEIDKKYQLEKISFSGAAGHKDFEGYSIDYSFNIGQRLIKLENVSVLKEKIKDSEVVYGNIGQDLIKKFNTVVFNFEEMYFLLE